MEINVNQSGSVNYNPINDDQTKVFEAEVNRFDEEVEKILNDPNLSVAEKKEKFASLAKEFNEKVKDRYTDKQLLERGLSVKDNELLQKIQDLNAKYNEAFTNMGGENIRNVKPKPFGMQ